MQNNINNDLLPNLRNVPHNMLENQDQMDIDNQRLQELFPELYPQIKPHIDEIVKMLQNQELNDSMIDSIADDIMNRMAEYGDFLPEYMDEAVPTQGRDDNFRGDRSNYWRYRRPNPYYRRRRYPMYYYDLSMRDLIRLLLRQP